MEQAKPSMEYKPKQVNIFCNVWGYIQASKLAGRIIRTEEFERLKYIRQLGPSHNIFTCAESSRFTHSIGVMHLSRMVASRLRKYHPELVSERFIEIIGIAGLVHDIGHGPLSHTFDYVVKDSPSPMKHHETRSKFIFMEMYEKYKLELTMDEIEFICDAIDPKKDQKDKWQYQILSNCVDTDRIDYLLRDSISTGTAVGINQREIERFITKIRIKNDSLFFLNGGVATVNDILSSRKRMYEKVYLNRESVILDEMYRKVFELVKHIPEYNFVNIIENDPNRFLELDDYIVRKIHRNPMVPKEAKQILLDIIQGNYYEHFYVDRKFHQPEVTFITDSDGTFLKVN